MTALLKTLHNYAFEIKNMPDKPISNNALAALVSIETLVPFGLMVVAMSMGWQSLASGLETSKQVNDDITVKQALVERDLTEIKTDIGVLKSESKANAASLKEIKDDMKADMRWLRVNIQAHHSRHSVK